MNAVRRFAFGLSLLAPAFASAATWIPTGSLNAARFVSVGILLHDGTVLAVSGSSTVPDTSELYDIATGRWTTVGPVGPAGRSAFAATMLRDGRVLVIGGSFSAGPTRSCRVYDPVAKAWGPAGSLQVARERHTATLLDDGRVLVAGGYDSSFAPVTSAEIYDPAADSWALTGAMQVARQRHTATLLRDGRVMVTGGRTTGSFRTPVTEVWNPGDGSWSRVGDLGTARNDHSATMLPDGRVLAAAGDSTNTAELFDPGSGLWTSTASLPEARFQHSATLLPSGRVLVAGGSTGTVLATAHVYDPGLGQWSAAPPLAFARYTHSATMLPDGRVLVAGGYNASPLLSAELYDADAPGWAAGSPMSAARWEASATLLKDGRVLVTGGVGDNTAEVYDPQAGSWTPTANNLSDPRWRHATVALVDGRVLVAGGLGSSTGSAELYDPSTNRWQPTASMASNRWNPTGTLLPCGQVLVVGGESSSGVALRTAERYDPHLGRWRPTGSMAVPRTRHTATLLRDGRVLVTGGFDGTAASPTAEIYDPAAETWSPTANSMALGLNYHTATLLPSGKVLVTGGLSAGTSAQLFDPATGLFTPTGATTYAHDTYSSVTLLPNGRVLSVGGFGTARKAEVYDPVVGAWTPAPSTAEARERHVAALLPDGRVLVAGGILSSTAEIYDVGRGESTGWRPSLTAATDPLVTGTPLAVGGSGFRGLGEGATGLGSMHSAANYPLVQLRRLDNSLVSWLPLDPAARWSGTTFRSLPVDGFPPGLALATVFTNGIPSVSRPLTVECPPPTITTDPASQTVCEGTAVSFSVASSGDCASHQWRKDGTAIGDGGIYLGTQTPILGLSGATLAAAGSYDAVVSLACSTTPATSAAAILTVVPSLGVVNASIAGPATVCTTCLGGTASEVHAGGGAVTYQWGFRTVSGGAVTDIPWATAPTYVLNGADFPAQGSYLLVVRLTPTCGVPQVSGEVGVTVSNAAPVLDEVPFFTITSTDRSNLLEWVYPAAYATVRIRYATAATATACSFPADPDLGGALLTTQTGVPGSRGSFLHDDATVMNDTTYCYTVFVDKGGGTWSAGRKNSGRPFATGGKVKWAFSSGGFSTTPPTVGGAGVIATNNDNAVHAMARGEVGGQWPGGWLPVRVGGAVQGRSPIVPITVGSSTPIAFVGAQDGRVYAVDAAVGGAAPSAPWPGGPAAIGGVVQAAPAGVFSTFGSGGYDYLLVGTRDAGVDNAFVALRPGDGSEAGRFAPAADPDRIGIVSGAASVEYVTPPRVYFTSRARNAANTKTLRCLEVGGAPFFSEAWFRDDLGDVDSSPVVRGGRVYVGSAAGGGTLYSLDSAGGGGARTFVHADGQVKGFVFPDRNSPTGDLVFSTSTRVWVVSDDGSALTPRWPGGIGLPGGATPSAALLLRGLSSPTSQHVFVGASDGRLYQLEVSTGTVDVQSVQLGDGTSTVGAPSYDLGSGLVHVGTAAGIFYAVQVPLP